MSRLATVYQEVLANIIDIFKKKTVKFTPFGKEERKFSLFPVDIIYTENPKENTKQNKTSEK